MKLNSKAVTLGLPERILRGLHTREVIDCVVQKNTGPDGLLIDPHAQFNHLSTDSFDSRINSNQPSSAAP